MDRARTRRAQGERARDGPGGSRRSWDSGVVERRCGARDGEGGQWELIVESKRGERGQGRVGVVRWGKQDDGIEDIQHPRCVLSFVLVSLGRVVVHVIFADKLIQSFQPPFRSVSSLELRPYLRLARLCILRSKVAQLTTEDLACRRLRNRLDQMDTWHDRRQRGRKSAPPLDRAREREAGKTYLLATSYDPTPAPPTRPQSPCTTCRPSTRPILRRGRRTRVGPLLRARRPRRR